MQLKSFFIATCVLSSIALTACQRPGDHSAPTAPTNAADIPAESGYQDISKLSLEQGLRAKYSRLQLVCQNHLVSYEPDPRDPAFSRAVRTDSPKEVVWDLLRDFRENKIVNFHKATELTEMNVQMDLSVKVHPGTLRMDRGLRQKFFIKNGVRLITQVESQVEQQDRTGRTLNSSSHGAEETAPVTIGEKMAQPIVKESVGQDNGYKYDVDLECELEADLKPAYQSDFQETHEP